MKPRAILSDVPPESAINARLAGAYFHDGQGIENIEFGEDDPGKSIEPGAETAGPAATIPPAPLSKGGELVRPTPRRRDPNAFR